MPKYIVRLADDVFVEWSTIVDAPVTPAMNVAELREFAKGTRPDQDPDQVVRRVLRRGHSALWMDEPMRPEDAINCNRCGPNEKRATLKQIIKMVTDWKRRDEAEQARQG